MAGRNSERLTDDSRRARIYHAGVAATLGCDMIEVKVVPV